MIHCPDDFDAGDRAFIDSCDLPDGAVIEGLIAIVSFIDPSTGGQRWLRCVKHDAPVTSVVGLLELAKFGILAATRGATRLAPSEDEETD